MTLMHVLYWGLIVWISSRLLIYERGLWGVFDKWRKLLGITQDQFGNPVASDSELSKLFSCLTCLSLWLALAVKLYNGDPWHAVLWYTGFSVLVNRATG